MNYVIGMHINLGKDNGLMDPLKYKINQSMPQPAWFVLQYFMIH